MQASSNPESHFRLLSELALSDESSSLTGRIAETAADMTEKGFEALATLSAKNHVVVRALTRWRGALEAEAAAKSWAEAVLQAEKARIGHAIEFLHKICSTLEKSGCPVTVIKSLDHWPDLGSDLDLYTDANAADIVRAMHSAFGAQLEKRSWGDRLANKWNFVVPGLPELVEIHIGRLGQTGEQTAITQSLVRRTQSVKIRNCPFRVLAPEDRIVISTLQRMYRHFYIRLCDIVDNAHLLDSQSVDFAYLYHIGKTGGIWEGIATYLSIISGYLETYRGHGVPLPSMVTASARFGVDQIQFRRDFLRVPILPHSMNLYAGELRTLLARGQVRNLFRLSLLPGLATAAALELKLTGSDKGIW